MAQRPEDRTKQIVRLMNALRLIQEQDGRSPQALAEALGCTERSVYRYVKALRQAGYPIELDEQRHYSLGRDFFLPPLALSLEESLALLVLAQDIAAKQQVPYLSAAETAFRKIKQQLPPSVKEELGLFDQRVAVRLTKRSPSEEIKDPYLRVRDAISRCRKLSCKYESRSKSSAAEQAAKNAKGDEEFLFRPYALLWIERAWYTVGHHEGRGEVRTLRLSRFSQIKPTDHPYAIPENFRVDDYFGRAWRMIKGPRHEVTIRFDADFAETIADTHWHSTQETEWQDDGSLLFKVTVDGLDEIVWWVLGMGPHCRVIEPQELADRVKQLAADVVTRYEADDGAAPKPTPKATKPTKVAKKGKS
jgi:proteasome accessory factor B